MVDNELPKAVQLEVVPILRKMLNERVLQTRDEHVDKAVCFLPRNQIECGLKLHIHLSRFVLCGYHELIRSDEFFVRELPAVRQL